MAILINLGSKTYNNDESSCKIQQKVVILLANNLTQKSIWP